jgi:hypothetical protein
MTRRQFFEAVQEAGIRASAFDLDGQGDECYVMSGNDNHWSVYYSERGLKTDKRHFGSEVAALEHLFGMLKNDPSTRI